MKKGAVVMTSANAKALLWSPRVLGMLVALFLGFLAIETLDRKGIAAFLLQVAPCVLMLLAVAVSWRREWVGAIVFFILASFYASLTTSRGDWRMAIAPPHSDVLFIPSIVVGLLFLWSWRHHEELRAQSGSPS